MDQHVRSQARDADMLRNLDYVKALGYRSKEALESGNLERFWRLMHDHWEHKKRRSGGISNPEIDNWYSLAMRNGAIGGKLVGAGGGGFLMFYATDRRRLRQTTFFVDCGYSERPPSSCDFRVGSLIEASRIILAQVNSR
jgi:D-glycero-alpha-D-manno-heptose-7-phosphate kinase